MKFLPLLLVLILLLTSCAPAAKSNADNTPPATPLTLLENGQSDYTVVYDDSDPTLSKLFNEFIDTLDKKLRITLPRVAASEAQEDYGHEILLGNARPCVEKKVEALQQSDFITCISEDDWVLYATSQSMYRYLFQVVSDRILAKLSKGALVMEKEITYSSSDLKEMSYAQRLALTNNGKLSAAHIRMITEAQTYKSESGTELLYRLYVPSNYDSDKKYPTVVFLHGAGDRGNDNDKQLSNMIETLFNLPSSPYLDSIVLIPQCPKEYQWVDTPWNKGNYSVNAVPQSEYLTATLEALDKLESTYSVDKDRIYAMGVSMGGFGTWDLLMRHPDRFAAGMPLCGAADPSMAATLKNMPIYTFHGDADPTVPVAGTRAMVAALKDVGNSKLIYEELPGADHLIQIPVFKRPEVTEWLFSQHK